MRLMFFACGLMMGLATLSVAMGSVPRELRKNAVTDDTALYQNLSEIRVPRQAALNFDADIARLSGSEARYKEKLPSVAKHPQLRGPMKRIAEQKYSYSGKRLN